MGKGGHNTAVVNDHHEQIDTGTLPAQHRLPTLSEIKVKIPGHCFRPTVRESMSYVIKDVFYVAVTFAVMFQLQTSLTYGFLFFPLYWFIQGSFDFDSPAIRRSVPLGTLYTSLFVLGHDCGHASFSFYPLLNDIVGT